MLRPERMRLSVGLLSTSSVLPSRPSLPRIPFSSFVFGSAMSKWSTTFSPPSCARWRERGAQRGRARLLRHVVGVVAGLGPEHGAAVPPQGRADLADAGAPGALLPPRLLARPADQGAVLGGVGAGASARAVLLDRLVEEVLVHARAEDVRVKDDVADLLVAGVDDVDRALRELLRGAAHVGGVGVRDGVLLLLADLALADLALDLGLRGVGLLLLGHFPSPSSG